MNTFYLQGYTFISNLMQYSSLWDINSYYNRHKSQAWVLMSSYAHCCFPTTQKLTFTRTRVSGGYSIWLSFIRKYYKQFEHISVKSFFKFSL